jgi:aspartyl-tRNA(Asn)/glutamyl-tRNA(Gln) amidotransferase subunit A
MHSTSDAGAPIDPQRPTAVALVHAYAQGSTDPVATIRNALERAGKSHGVFISTSAERALAAASASAERWRTGRPLSVLDGVPIAWKDLFDTAGVVTTAGSAVFSTREPASEDAALVAAGMRVGLVGIGKTNLSEFAYSGLGLNPHFGTPANPAFDAGAAKDGVRVPGGSSSGAAIAVAAGIVPLAVGTDTGGSVRIPAAFNGLTGYRASTARYPRGGMTMLSPTLDTIGPIARDVADCVAFDAVVRGVPPIAALPALYGQRFVVDPSMFERFAVTDSVAANFTGLIERLKEAGATIDTQPVTSLTDVCDLIRDLGWLGALEAFARHRVLLDSADASRIDPRVRKRLEASRTVPAERHAELIARRAELISAFGQELGDRTLVLPTVPHVAPRVAPLEQDPDLFARVNLATLSLTMPGSFLDTPAVALPSGVDAQHLPTSVQLMRAQNDDDALLAVALAVERHIH